MADKYLTVEEQAIYSEKLHSIIDSLEQELKKVQEKLKLLQQVKKILSY